MGRVLDMNEVFVVGLVLPRVSASHRAIGLEEGVGKAKPRASDEATWVWPQGECMSVTSAFSGLSFLACEMGR